MSREVSCSGCGKPVKGVDSILARILAVICDSCVRRRPPRSESEALEVVAQILGSIGLSFPAVEIVLAPRSGRGIPKRTAGLYDDGKMILAYRVWRPGRRRTTGDRSPRGGP